MDNQIQIDKILSLVQTKSEAGEVLVCLEDFSGTLFLSKEKLPIAEYFSRLKQELSDELVRMFANKTAAEKDRGEAGSFLRDLQEALRSCKILQLTIAFHSDDETTAIFSSWLKKNLANNVLICRSGVLMQIQCKKIIMPVSTEILLYGK